jgi:hypothetical protein
MLLIIREPATQKQLEQMLKVFAGIKIKLAVDIERQILAGGGELHSDCEEALLEDGSQQANIWGADWIPPTKKVEFESIINLRPRQQNFSMEVADFTLRGKIELIVRNLLEIE